MIPLDRSFSNFDYYNQSTGLDMQSHPNPIEWLCSDILAEIFTFCLPDMPEEFWKVECISTRKAPLLLCFVCSSWRSIAISTPRLWQTLHLHSYHPMFSSDTRDSESVCSGIRTWLDRSRALPLSIRLDFRPEIPKWYEVIKFRLTFKALLQEVSRWESFELDEGEHGFWVDPPHFDVLQMLHTFNISYSSINGIPFTAAPSLKRLSLYSLPNLTSVSAIPWGQLVELTIEEAQTISVVVEVIQCCYRLELLSLSVEDADGDGSLAFGSIMRHDTLRRLHLYGLPYINAVTDRLTLPALTDLSLRTVRSISRAEPKFCCSQLVDFFTRSNCKLQQFELRCRRFGPGEFMECLSHQTCQTLTRLVIQQCGNPSPPMISRELLIRLTYPDVDDDVPLCPKLGHLELIKCYRPDKSFPDLLGRMIQSRCFGRARDAQLKSFRVVDVHYSVSKEDNEWLKHAQNVGGLELRYS